MFKVWILLRRKNWLFVFAVDEWELWKKGLNRVFLQIGKLNIYKTSKKSLFYIIEIILLEMIDSFIFESWSFLN